MVLAHVKGIAHHHLRPGTTTLFAALNVLNSTVLAGSKPRHRRQKLLPFRVEIDQ